MSQASKHYGIGAVASMTGLPSSTIRTWERRHAAIRPERASSGRRVYRERDVERLRLLRSLTAAGDAIGDIAALDDDALRGRLTQRAAVSRSPHGEGLTPGAPVRVATVHRSSGRRFEAEDARWKWTLVGAFERLDALFARPPACDVFVAQLDRLGDQPEVALVRAAIATEARVLVVEYEFATRRVLDRLARHGAVLVRGPTSVRELEWQLAARLAQDRVGSSFMPPTRGDRRYSDEQLEQLRALSSSLDCECPQHLATIITSLVAFERYSEQCADRSPEDALVHERIRRQTGRARDLMEEMLSVVCEQDGITV